VWKPVSEMRRPIFSQRALAIACTLAGGSCLPGDTRPPPGVAHITVSPAGALLTGVPSSVAEDGWAIHYEKFLIGVGRVSLEGDACAVYSDAEYTRVFDLLVPGAQKVSDQYALGECGLGFRVVTPSSESLLGAEVVEADVAFMRTPGSNKYAADSGVSMYLAGHADNGGQTKRFAWAFRWRVAYDECTVGTAADSAAPRLSFEGGQAQDVDIAVGGDAPFLDNPDPALGTLRFVPFAEADDQGDADSDITLAELDHVPLAGAAARMAYQSSVAALPQSIAATLGAEPTLADYLYVSALPSVPRYRGVGECTVSVRPTRGEDF
jgi:hypothetical protein